MGRWKGEQRGTLSVVGDSYYGRWREWVESPGGKTVVAALIIHGAIAKGKRILFLAHRRELIEQPSEKLDAMGVSHGIVMANHWRHRPLAPCQVASIQTLVNRDLAYPPDLVLIDEAHRARAKTYVWGDAQGSKSLADVRYDQQNGFNCALGRSHG